jgi:AraC-like DNA-binding protein
MRQRPTVLNAQELLGDFFDLDRIQEQNDGHQVRWEWPKEIGSGYLTGINLRPGLMLGVGNYRLVEDIVVHYDFRYSPITLGFSLSGNIRHTINHHCQSKNIWHFRHGHCVMSYLPECRGITRPATGAEVDCVYIAIAPQLLKTFMDEEQDRLPSNLRALGDENNDKLYCQAAVMTPSIRGLIDQIRNCPPDLPFKRLYLESKTSEVIAQFMGQFVTGNGASSTATLRLEDLKRIRTARDILIDRLDTPPSLFELARLVGINKNKLNRGFRHLFGTSVFDYLRIQRLETARDLLEKNHCNVTGAALEVGYSQQSSFSKAFKNYFGTNPTDHTR